MATNVQLKGNSSADPWFVIEGRPEEIVNILLEVFPTLGPVDGPEQFPSVVARARALWAAQVTTAQTLDAHEVETQQIVDPQPQPAYQAPQQQAPASPWGQSRSAPVGSAPANQSSAPLDPFGKPMKWIQGVSKSSGKEYKGWFADYPKGGMPNGVDIPPIFVR